MGQAMDKETRKNLGLDSWKCKFSCMIVVFYGYLFAVAVYMYKEIIQLSCISIIFIDFIYI